MVRRPRDTLLGRESSVEAVLALLREGGRTVTLVGPAGIGKTSIARAVAERWGARARFVDATEVHEPFADRELRVVDDVGTEPLPVVPSSGALLAITRTPRGHAGELVVPVPPLALGADGPAAQLWARRAREIDATWRLAPRDASVLTDVLLELDGWPLAIERAVGVARILGLRELRARLRELGRHADTLPFAPLTDAIARDLETLSERERLGLARLLAFRGEFTPAGAESVVDAPWTLELLATLRDRGWVRTHEDEREVRFELLRFVRRAVAPSVPPLDEREARALRERHAHVVSTEATHPRSVPDLLAVAHDASAFAPRLVVDALVALDRIAWLREPIRELPALADRVLAEALDPATEARVREIRGRLRLRRRELDDAAHDLRSALAIARTLGNLTLEALALRSLAEHASLTGAHEHAIALAEEALAVPHESIDEALASAELHASLQRTLGTVHRRAGQALEARAALERAAASLPSRGPESERVEPLRAVVLCELALLELELGRMHVARDLAERSRRVLERHELAYVGAYLHAALGAAHHASGELDGAWRAYGAAAHFAARTGDEHLATIVGGYLAALRVERGESDARLELHERIDELDRTGHGRDAASARALFAFLEARTGRSESAQALVERVLDPADGSNHALAIALFRAGTRALVDDSVDARARLDAARADAKRGGRRDRDGADEGLTDLRLALRLTAGLEAESGLDTLTLASDGVIHLPGGGRVDLAARPLLLRLFRALSQHHHAQPGEALSVEALLEAGWPGQRMVGSSGPRRLQVAIGRLRESGLREILESDGAGYRLSPRWRVIWNGDLFEDRRSR